jgi:phospholipase C
MGVRSLANALRIARFGEPGSARALADEYRVSPPISIGELIDTVLGYSAFDRVNRFFVLVLENRSFDHMLGFSKLNGIDAVTGAETDLVGLSNITEVDGMLLADESNTDSKGARYQAQAPTDIALQVDPGHEFVDMKQQLGWGPPGPRNEGFVRNFESHIASALRDDPDSPTAQASPGVVMRCMHPDQVPVLATLARKYAVCDMWFASAPLPTWPNRMFIHAASSGGMDDSPGWSDIAEHDVAGYEFENGTIFNRLEAAGLKWQVYEGDEYPVSWAFAGVHGSDITDMDDFHDEVLDNDFPYSYVFIEPNYDCVPTGHYEDGNSQHPYGSITKGELLISRIYDALRASPHWEESAFVILYDEGGGFFDHVAPPDAVPPGDKVYPERVGHSFDFTKLGPRIPAVIVSPWIPEATIDHTQYDHTSLLNTVERRFGLAPLTDRDASAADFAHLFRLRSPRTDRLVWSDTSAPSESQSLRTSAGLAPSTPIEQVPKDVIGFLGVALMKERRTRPVQQRSALASRVRAVSTLREARELIKRLEAERPSTERITIPGPAEATGPARPGAGP